MCIYIFIYVYIHIHGVYLLSALFYYQLPSFLRVHIYMCAHSVPLKCLLACWSDLLHPSVRMVHIESSILAYCTVLVTASVFSAMGSVPYNVYLLVVQLTPSVLYDTHQVSAYLRIIGVLVTTSFLL